ncbi:MAG TPA: preprotein translocase subunit SecY [Clostridia bacterium]|nr:preprotein translocase subunit SecY [Clostridia bacterium]
MLDTLRAALRIGDLRKRLFFTLWIFLVIRLGAHVPVPGINPSVVARLFREGTLFGLMDLFSGGALSSFSVFAMSIYPYVNASIIIQLLTMVIPKLEEMAKEGEEGRRKLNEYTRYGTVLLAFIQAIGMAFWMRGSGALYNTSILHVITVAISLTAGTVFLMWLGEQITDKGIGNGISLVIFVNIVSRFPMDIGNVVTLVSVGRLGIGNVVGLVVVAAATIAAIVLVQEGQRRVPVQYSKRVVGRRMYGGQSTHIPMRLNHAGVIPVIFASAVLSFPATIAAFIRHPLARQVETMFSGHGVWYQVAYALLIIFFTYFYTAVTFNPLDVANNLKKWGGFIPGIRPGKPTAEYLERVLTRITLPGAAFLALIAVLPGIVMGITGVPTTALRFGGTAILIVVGVALETMKQIEAHLLMRQYKGFIT